MRSGSGDNPNKRNNLFGDKLKEMSYGLYGFAVSSTQMFIPRGGIIALTQPPFRVQAVIQKATFETLPEVFVNSRVSFSKVATYLHRTEGWRTFFRGLDASLTKEFVSCAMKTLGIKVIGKKAGEIVTHYRGADAHGNKTLTSIVTAIVGPLVENTIKSPFEFVKTRIMTTTGSNSSLYSSLAELQAKGMKGSLVYLYKGFFITYYKAVALYLSILLGTDVTKDTLKLLGYEDRNDGSIDSITTKLIASTAGGAIAGFTTTPFDMIKVNLQKPESNIPEVTGFKTVDSAIQIYKRGGVKDFYRASGVKTGLTALNAFALCCVMEFWWNNANTPTPPKSQEQPPCKLPDSLDSKDMTKHNSSTTELENIIQPKKSSIEFSLPEEEILTKGLDMDLDQHTKLLAGML